MLTFKSLNTANGLIVIVVLLAYRIIARVERGNLLKSTVLPIFSNFQITLAFEKNDLKMVVIELPLAFQSISTITSIILFHLFSFRPKSSGNTIHP